MIVPEEGTPEFLKEDVRLKRPPRYGDAVVVPSQAKGTFWSVPKLFFYHSYCSLLLKASRSSVGPALI